jgi:OOP family OmpA-OmpF porin
VSASSIKVDLENSRIRTPKISFKSNSDSPTPESRAVLKQLAAVLAQSPELTVRIEGHTDTIGYDQPNLELSQRRADRVKEILTQDGVNATRLQAIGMGDRHPIASSVTTAGQEKNRRVEFHLADGSPARGPAPAPAAPPPPPPPTTMPAAPAVK